MRFFNFQGAYDTPYRMGTTTMKSFANGSSGLLDNEKGSVKGSFKWVMKELSLFYCSLDMNVYN